MEPVPPAILSGGVSKTWGRLLADLWLVGTGSVVFTSLRLAFACSGTVRYVTPAPVVRHQPALAVCRTYGTRFAAIDSAA